jgi:hypothetical protein
MQNLLTAKLAKESKRCRNYLIPQVGGGAVGTNMRRSETHVDRQHLRFTSPYVAEKIINGF